MTAGAKKNGCNNSRKIVITAHSQHQNTWQHEGYRSHPCSQQAMAGATSSPSQLQQLFSCCKVQSYSVWHSSAQIHICSLPPWCKLNSTVTPSPDWEWQPLLKWTWADFQKNVTFNWVSKRFQFLSWSTAAIHNRNKWCIYLLSDSSSGWDEGVIKEHGEVVLFIIPLSEALCFPIMSTEIVNAMGTHYF